MGPAHPLVVDTLLSNPLSVSEPLSWLVLATFGGAALLRYAGDERARPVAVVGWALFAVFWAVLTPHFVFEQKSIVESVGSVAAVPLSAYVGYHIWNGRDSLFTLTRAVALMGLLYVPFLTVTPLERVIVEVVTRQTEFVLSLVGFDPAVIVGEQTVRNGKEVLVYKGALIADKDHPFRSTFLFDHGDYRIVYTILLACTGVGSMSIFGGLVLAVDAPWRRKLRALAMTLPVIYVLNILRNVFIAASFGQQLLHVQPDLVMTVFGLSDPRKVSYFLADRVIAQSLSVAALVVITYFVVQELPEILTVIEDALFLVTGTEYDLQEALDVSREPVRADGGDGAQ